MPSAWSIWSITWRRSPGGDQDRPHASSGFRFSPKRDRRKLLIGDDRKINEYRPRGDSASARSVMSVRGSAPQCRCGEASLLTNSPQPSPPSCRMRTTTGWHEPSARSDPRASAAHGMGRMASRVMPRNSDEIVEMERLSAPEPMLRGWIAGGQVSPSRCGVSKKARRNSPYATAAHGVATIPTHGQ